MLESFIQHDIFSCPRSGFLLFTARLINKRGAGYRGNAGPVNTGTLCVFSCTVLTFNQQDEKEEINPIASTFLFFYSLFYSQLLCVFVASGDKINNHNESKSLFEFV